MSDDKVKHEFDDYTFIMVDWPDPRVWDILFPRMMSRVYRFQQTAYMLDKGKPSLLVLLPEFYFSLICWAVSRNILDPSYLQSHACFCKSLGGISLEVINRDRNSIGVPHDETRDAMLLLHPDKILEWERKKSDKKWVDQIFQV